MANRVIDVSRFNGTIDFAKVKADGIWGVIIKAGVTGYGASHAMYKDDNFEQNYAAAKAAGLHVGAYYYSGAMTEDFAVKEAKYFLSLIAGKQFDLPVYMDVEETHSPTNMPGLGKTKLTAVVKKWCETVEAAGYYTGFYAMKSWCGTYLDMEALSRFTFWLAHWVSQTSYTGPFGMWQYTDAAKVNGISGNVDCSYCYQDFPAIIKEAGLNGYAKAEKPVEDNKLYTLTISPLSKYNVDRLVKLLAENKFYGKVTEVADNAGK